MRRSARRVRWAALGVVVAVLGVRDVVHLRALGEAERTRATLARRYGEGCVAVMDKADRPALLSCRLSGIRVDLIASQIKLGEESLALLVLCLDPKTGAAARVVADSFTTDGHPLGSTVPIVPFPEPPHFGEPGWHGQRGPLGASYPLVVALREPRLGE